MRERDDWSSDDGRNGFNPHPRLAAERFESAITRSPTSGPRTLPQPYAPSEELATADPTRRLLTLFLAGKSEATLREYSRSLRHFASWIGESDTRAAIGRLLAGGHGAATEAAMSYQNSLMEKGLSPATINLMVTSVRSVIRMARAIDLIGWTIDIPQLPTLRFRDTRGPGVGAVRAMLSVCKQPRDSAILHLLFDLALRSIEVVRLDVSDYTENTLMVMGKGRRDRSALTIPAPARLALEGWLIDRGTAPGPLFVSLDRVHSGARLSTRGLRWLVAELGERAGVGHVRCHGLRHSGITAALDLTGGDVRAVAGFSRHRDIRTVMIYDDNRRDEAGRIAEMVAGATGGK